MTDPVKRISMDLNNKKRKGGVALASRRLGRVEKGQPLILGANKMEGGYNFAVEASEDSEVSLLLYKKEELPHRWRSLFQRISIQDVCGH